jgi:negative regulator of flagellin synthesis FlgM
MKINGSTEASRLDVPSGTSSSKAGPAAGAEPAGVAVSVRLSEGLASLSAQDSAADFDAGRVEQIKQSIREGSFQVDSGVVADKLIASVNDLFGKVH